MTLVFGAMVSTASYRAADQNGLREMARCPRESDGIGTALRQIFGHSSGTPADLSSLLNRIKTIR